MGEGIRKVERGLTPNRTLNEVFMLFYSESGLVKSAL